MAAAEVQEFGTGIYALTELHGFIAYQRQERLAQSRVLYWVRHALTQTQHKRRRPDYTFHDLVSLFVVSELVDAGVQPHVVRDAEEHLRTTLGLARPFAAVSLYTDGVDVLYRAAPEMTEQITAANRRGQEVLRPVIQAALRGIKYEAGVASSWDPAVADSEQLVSLDPTIQFGEPCIAGTRIQTATLAREVRAGSPLTVVAASYAVEVDAVRAAVSFEDELAALAA
jgi:uncharacterized protein (DUF433 family)